MITWLQLTRIQSLVIKLGTLYSRFWLLPRRGDVHYKEYIVEFWILFSFNYRGK